MHHPSPPRHRKSGNLKGLLFNLFYIHVPKFFTAASKGTRDRAEPPARRFVIVGLILLKNLPSPSRMIFPDFIRIRGGACFEAFVFHSRDRLAFLGQVVNIFYWLKRAIIIPLLVMLCDSPSPSFCFGWFEIRLMLQPLFMSPVVFGVLLLFPMIVWVTLPSVPARKNPLSVGVLHTEDMTLLFDCFVNDMLSCVHGSSSAGGKNSLFCAICQLIFNTFAKKPLRLLRFIFCQIERGGGRRKSEEFLSNGGAAT